MKTYLWLTLTVIEIVISLTVAFISIGLLWWLAGHPGLTLFEDGSWIIFHRNFMNGCVPHMICNVGH